MTRLSERGAASGSIWTRQILGIVQERSVMRYPGGGVDSNGRDFPDGFGIGFF